MSQQQQFVYNGRKVDIQTITLFLRGKKQTKCQVESEAVSSHSLAPVQETKRLGLASCLAFPRATCSLSALDVMGIYRLQWTCGNGAGDGPEQMVTVAEES